MNYIELLQKIIDGKINIEYNEHYIIEDIIIEKAKSKLEYANDLISDPEDSQSIYIYNTICKSELTYNKLILSLFNISIHCKYCGAELSLYLIDENNLSFVETLYWDKDLKRAVINNDKCIIKNDPIVSYINVTDALVFANYFPVMDWPSRDMRYQRAFELDTHLGLCNRSQHLAHKGFGFGQVGNTSINIFMKKDKIIIAEAYNSCYDGYELVGNIILDIWRWMCADKNTLSKNNIEIKNDNIICDVPLGKWKITHYDNTNQHLFDGKTIASLELIGN